MVRRSPTLATLLILVLAATASVDDAASTADTDDICSSSVPRNTLLASCGPCGAGAACIVYDQDPAAPKLTGCDFETGSSDAFCTNENGRARSCEFECFSKLRDASTFAFVVPFKTALPASSSRRPPPSSLQTTDTVPFQSNVFVDAIGPLNIPATVSKIAIYGGRQEVTTKDRTVNMTVAATAFSSAPQLSSITLVNMNLSDGISNALASMPPTMTFLDLRNTQLNQLPDGMAKFTQLTTLSLSANALSSINLTLPQLNSLDLSDNKLTSFIASAPQLHSLDLSNNNLTEIPSSIFKLASLRVLNLGKNPIAGPLVLSPAEAIFLQSLEDLKIDVQPSTKATAAPSPSDTANGNRPLTTTIAGATVLVMIPNANLTAASRGSGSSNGSASGSTGGDTVTLPTPQPSLRNPTSSDTASTGRKNGGSSTLLVVLIVIGAVIVVITAAFGLLWRRRRNAAKYNAALYFGGDSYTKMNSEANDSGSVVSRSIFMGDLPSWADSELLSYRLRHDNIKDARVIGTGSTAVVWLVSYRGGAHQFASKRPIDNGTLTADRMTAMVAEIKLAASLSHPSVVQFFGVAWTNETDLQALFEYMPNGDLRAYLSQNDPFAADWMADKLRLALDVIEALVYTHSFDPPLAHRDLKSRNVLLSEDFRAKVSDFGCGRYGSEYDTIAADGVGTGRWLAPEILSGSSGYDTASDIYSFGVLLTELDTHLVPYADIVGAKGKGVADEAAVLQRVAHGDLQPSLSASCPLVVRQIARACMAFHASHRPTAIQVAYSLRQALRPSST